MSSVPPDAPQETRAQYVALLPSRLRMIVTALEASQQSYTAALVTQAAARIEELESALREAAPYLTNQAHRDTARRALGVLS